MKITKERADELFKEIKRYNPADDIAEAVKSIDTVFAMYAQDLKNASAAIESSTKKVEQEIATDQEQVKAEIAINAMQGSAEVVVDSGTKVKEQLKPIVEDTEEWAWTIIGLGVIHRKRLSQHLKIKTKWSNLSALQIAEALAKLKADDPTVKMENFKTTKIHK